MLEDLIHSRRKTLTDTDWAIISYLQASAGELGTIEDLAQAVHVSTTTVFRFCQKLGLSGFAQLKAYLKAEPSQPLGRERQVQDLYHSIVNSLCCFDSCRLKDQLAQVEEVYVYAQSEIELRLAKALQRIFFPLGKKILLLPHEQALTSSLVHLQGQLLWVLVIDSMQGLPLILQNSHELANFYTFLLSDVGYLPVLANDCFMMPTLEANPQLGQDLPSITPYILALELLYLKILLDDDTFLQKV